VSEISLELKGFEQVKKLFNSVNFKKRLRKYVGKATTENAKLAKEYIEASIKSGSDYEANSPITVALKGSSTPLFETGQLARSISTKRASWNLSFVGVMTWAPKYGSMGEVRPLIEIASILHEGAVLPISKKMRNFFAGMSRKDARWRPIPGGVSSIYIPPRPFLKTVLHRELMIAYRFNWGLAVKYALVKRS
jgi:hypothetical protein